jgi:hypothetical protein
MILVQNLVLYAGRDFSQSISLTDANNNPMIVTGYSANGAFKKDPFANTMINSVYAFSCNLSNGNLTLTLSAGSSANIYPGVYVYDVVLWSTMATIPIAEGLIQVEPFVATTNTGI